MKNNNPISEFQEKNRIRGLEALEEMTAVRGGQAYVNLSEYQIKIDKKPNSDILMEVKGQVVKR